jgi:hypothetical protein
LLWKELLRYRDITFGEKISVGYRPSESTVYVHTTTPQFEAKEMDGIPGGVRL